MSSPNDIEVMIHCYGTRSVHPRIDAPAVQSAIERFLAAGLPIQTDESGIFEATDGGKLFVEALCAVPWPERRWVLPQVVI